MKTATALADPEVMVAPLTEVKAVKAPDEERYQYLEGVASVFDVLDLWEDVVVPGAFKKTIMERVPKRLVKFLDGHRYAVRDTLGTVVEAEETELGLWFKAELASTPDVQMAAQKAAEGHLKLSIGYHVIDDDWKKDGDDTVRYLTELRLVEISLVPLAANEETFVTLVKSLVPFQALPIADEGTEWNPAEALTRVKEWAHEGQKIDWTRYRKGFLLWDRDEPTQFGSYRLPIADVIDGELKAVPRALYAASTAMMTEVLALDEDETKGAKRHLERYYGRMERKAPWQRDGDFPWDFLSVVEEAISTKEGRVLSQRNYDRLQEALSMIQDVLSSAEPAKATHGQPADDDPAGPHKAPTGWDQKVRARMLKLGLDLATISEEG